MAKTKNEKYIVEQYVRYFGKTPTKAQIDDYAKVGKQKEILDQIMGDANDAKPSNIPYEEYIDSIFQNLFGRPASGPEKTKYEKTYDKEGVLPINSIVKSAKKSDKDVYATKIAVALFIAEKGSTTNFDLDKITKKTYAEIYNPKTKKLLVDSVAQLETKIDAMPDNDTVTVKTFNLTASADTGSKFVGTDKGDVFKADSFVSATGNYLATLNSSDELDGGAGKDTLNITVETDPAAPTPYTMATATIKNIETITIKGANNVTADVSGSNITGLETISVLKSVDATVKAAATTDVNVSGATGIIKVDGGKNVTVTDATADNNITIGATTGATGTITVTDTKQGTGDIKVDGGTNVTVTATAADISTGATSTTGTIKVGQTATATLPTGDIKVTQNLEFDGNDAGATGDTTDLTGGDITISGGKTVDVTVNANNVAKVATAAHDIEVGTITVKGGDNTTTVTVTQNDNAQTFTSAKVAEVKDTQTITFKALTSGQKVSITDGTNALTFTASKDLTAEEVAAAFAGLVADDRQDNGGKVANGVYTGQFSSNWSAKSVSGATVTFEAPVSNTTTLADNASSVAPTFGTVVNGTVASGGNESLNSVVYGQVVINNTAKTGTTDAIKTVTVDGYAATSTIASNALTDLTLKNSAGTMGVTTTVASLNLSVDNINDDVTLTAANLKTLNLTTTGEESEFDFAGAGAGAIETLTIAAGADLTTDGSDLAALKTATITGAGDVDLGDLSAVATFATLTATAATGDISAEVDADVVVTTGSGNDTITVTAAATTTAISKAIDLGAGDDTLTLTAGTTAIPTAAVKGGAGVDTISMTFTSAASYDDAELFKNAISGFERLEISNAYGTNDATANQFLSLDMEKLGFNYVITNGTVADDTAADSDDLRLINLAANSTVVLNKTGLISAALKTPTGETDVINVVTNVTTSAVDFGTFTVASVETVNITANDTQLDDNSDDVIDSSDIVEVATLNLTANAAKTVNVKGNSNLTLDTVSTTITKVDASAMTGDLVYTADGATAGTEVIGGAGNDTLRASDEKDVLKGGAGNDTFYATDLTTVYGGAGADKFYFATPTQLSKVSTIADLGSGDTIYLIDNNGSGDATDDIVNTFYAAGAQYNPNTTTTFESKVNASLVQTGAGESTWFQHAGNTYIVIDNKAGGDPLAGAVDTYTAGTDIVIEITGVVDLSTASFNSTTGTLEIA